MKAVFIHILFLIFRLFFVEVSIHYFTLFHGISLVSSIFRPAVEEEEVENQDRSIRIWFPRQRWAAHGAAGDQVSHITQSLHLTSYGWFCGYQSTATRIRYLKEESDHYGSQSISIYRNTIEGILYGRSCGHQSTAAYSVWYHMSRLMIIVFCGRRSDISWGTNSMQVNVRSAHRRTALPPRHRS